MEPKPNVNYHPTENNGILNLDKLTPTEKKDFLSAKDSLQLLLGKLDVPAALSSKEVDNAAQKLLELSRIIKAREDKNYEK